MESPPEPQYGKRLLPQIIDDLAATEPDRIIYSIAKSSDISQGFRTVSARAFASAVDRTAWLLHNQLGESLAPSVPAVAYIGPRECANPVILPRSYITNWVTDFVVFSR